MRTDAQQRRGYSTADFFDGQRQRLVVAGVDAKSPFVGGHLRSDYATGGRGGALMQAYWTLTRRELASYFMSMTGYIIIAAATLLIGVSFKAVLEPLQHVPTLMPVTELFFNTVFFWLVLLLPPAIITMRLFAFEKFSGTFET